jgi:predicted DNA-binding transcriptional regulator AlpA
MTKTDIPLTGTDDEIVVVGWSGASRASGRSIPSLKRDVRAGRFPEPMVLGPNRLGWRKSWIGDWLATRPRRRYRSAPEPQS